VTFRQRNKIQIRGLKVAPKPLPAKRAGRCPIQVIWPKLVLRHSTKAVKKNPRLLKCQTAFEGSGVCCNTHKARLHNRTGRKRDMAPLREPTPGRRMVNVVFMRKGHQDVDVQKEPPQIASSISAMTALMCSCDTLAAPGGAVKYGKPSSV